MNLKFPKNFLWGASTSAHQIEGGNVNDWSEWEKSEKRIKELKSKNLNPDDFISGSACDSYHRYEEDFDLAKKLNNNAHRFSLEWSRIEPEEGKFDQLAIEHYRKVLQAGKKRGLKLVVTLWHWTNPIWIARMGGWTNKKTVDYFCRYAEFIAKEFGEYVDFWVTLNEPMAHVGFGYVGGNFPPNKKFDLLGARKVLNNLAQAHIKAYQKIHEIIPGAQIGFTSLTDYFEPANKWNPLDLLINSVARYFHHRIFLNKVCRYLDYVGVDYYFHQKISCWPPFRTNENKEVNDMGWEIYPAGIYQVLKYLSKFKKPIYIMENGIANEDDKKRSKFILDHLRFVHQAIQDGMDVRGYFYWSLLDNFEWAHGFAPKFGLYAVDRKTFKRTMRPSAKVYGEICGNNEVKI
jgi:beta-glucosidase